MSSSPFADEKREAQREVTFLCPRSQRLAEANFNSGLCFLLLCLPHCLLQREVPLLCPFVDTFIEPPGELQPSFSKCDRHMMTPSWEQTMG